jgi:RNA polymerase sigma-70 factor (ECF subfamily)
VDNFFQVKEIVSSTSLTRQRDQSFRNNALTSLEQEFQKLVSDYTERVYNHAYRMLGNREDAEEAANDIFLRIYRGLNSFRGDAAISTWIWRITSNVCLSRRSRVRIVTEPLDSVEGEGRFESTEIPPADSRVETEENRERIARCIAALPEQEAGVITLFYLQELDYREIAEAMQMPTGTVATHLHRGRERLRKMMQTTTKGDLP